MTKFKKTIHRNKNKNGVDTIKRKKCQVKIVANINKKSQSKQYKIGLNSRKIQKHNFDNKQTYLQHGRGLKSMSKNKNVLHKTLKNNEKELGGIWGMDNPVPTLLTLDYNEWMTKETLQDWISKNLNDE